MVDLADFSVVVSDADSERIQRANTTWSAPRLVGLLFVTLATALTMIYIVASREFPYP